MRRFLDWFFRDRVTGRVVIGQWPNLPLWLFALAAALGWGLEATGLDVPAGVETALHWAARASLAWWALDEVLRGVNPWRRCLGGAVLLWIVLGLLIPGSDLFGRSEPQAAARADQAWKESIARVPRRPGA